MKTVLRGGHIRLRKFRLSDAPLVQKYCNERNISKWITAIPHPYRKSDAVNYIRGTWKKWRKKTDYEYAVEHEGLLIGSLGIHVKPDDKAELGWWIGKPFRGQGFATEAAKLAAAAAFKTLKLHRITSRCLAGNAASAGVMKNLGMKKEGRMREDAKRGGKYLDVVWCGVLAREFKA